MFKILNNDQVLKDEYINTVKQLAAKGTSIDYVITCEKIKNIITELFYISDTSFNGDLDKTLFERTSVEIFYHCLYTYSSDFTYYIDKYFKKEKISKN